jgi:hypothetical protein
VTIANVFPDFQEEKAHHKDEGRILGWIEENIMSEIYDLTKEIW